MSKRVSNDRDARSKARYGRVRIGWKRARAISHLQRQREQLGMDSTPEAKVLLQKVGTALRTLLPKKVVRRHQSR